MTEFDKSTSRIAWPLHNNDHVLPGYIVGWNVRSFDVCVATIVSGVELGVLEKILAKFYQQEWFLDLNSDCHGLPIVLGEYQVMDSPVPSHVLRDSAVKKQTANIWLTMARSSAGYPVLRETHCCGYKYRPHMQLLYCQPQCISAERLCLDISQANKTMRRTEMGSLIRQLNAGTGFEEKLQEAVALYISSIEAPPPVPVLQHPSPKLFSKRAQRPTPNSTTDTSASPFITHTANLHASSTPAAILDNSAPAASFASTVPADLITSAPASHSSEAGHPTTAHTPASSNSAAAASHSGTASNTTQQHHPTAATTAHTTAAATAAHTTPSSTTTWLRSCTRACVFAWTCAGSVASHLLAVVLMGLFLFAQGTCLCLDTPLPFGIGKPRHFSAVGRQVSFRLRQILAWPRILLLLQRPLSDSLSRAHYVRFNTQVVLIALDMLAGLWILLAITSYPSEILVWAHEQAHFFQYDLLRSAVVWLMGIPAGLKLNDNLDATLGDLSLRGIDFWAQLVSSLSPHSEFLFNCVCISAVFGASMLICMLSDIISAFTLHVRLFYALSARIHATQLGIFSSLWKLFMGKKRNVLRQRVDSCDYSLEQTLMGTLMFTVMFFLFPTTSIYYYCFAIIYAMVSTCQIVFGALLAVLNHFPFFSLGLYIFCPHQLSSGVCWTACFPNGKPIGSEEPVDASFGAILRELLGLSPAQKRNNAATSTGAHSSVTTTAMTSDPNCQSTAHHHPRPEILTATSPTSPCASPFTRSGSSDTLFPSGTGSPRRNASSGSLSVLGSDGSRKFRSLPPTATYFLMQHSPPELGHLFYEYRAGLGRVLRHYTVGLLVRSLLLGRPVPPPPPTSATTTTPTPSFPPPPLATTPAPSPSASNPSGGSGNTNTTARNGRSSTGGGGGGGAWRAPSLHRPPPLTLSSILELWLFLKVSLFPLGSAEDFQ